MAKRRKRGNGSLHLRKDGRWEGRIVVGYDEKGLPRTKNVLAKTKSECSAKLNALKASLQGPHEPKQEKPKADMTFGAWLDHWYQRECKPKIRPKTQADYENRIYQHIIPELGSISLAKLTAADLQQFYNRLKEGGRLLRVEQYGPGLSDRMVKSCHVTCRMALDQAVAQGLILKNPALSCKAPATHPREMQVLTGEEIQRLLIQAKEDDCFELLLLELTTGLRRGEILASSGTIWRAGLAPCGWSGRFSASGGNWWSPSPRPGPPAGASSCPHLSWPSWSDIGKVFPPDGCSHLREKRTPHWTPPRCGRSCPPC